MTYSGLYWLHGGGTKQRVPKEEKRYSEEKSFNGEKISNGEKNLMGQKMHN